MKMIYSFKDYHKYIKVLFWILVVIHSAMLYFLGIAWFGTTLLFYGLIYLVGLLFIKLFKNKKWQELLKRNWQVLIGLLLVIELGQIFLIKSLNTFIENKYGVYLSSYKVRNQELALDFLKIKKNILPWTEGYFPNALIKHQTIFFNYKYVTNELGLRGKLPNKEKRKDEYRIIILGDSFVEGYGVPTDSTFPYLLEKKLKESNSNISVINGGICGSNPLYEIELYKNKLESYKGNKVLMLVNKFDVDDINYVINQGKMPFDEIVYSTSRIARGIINILSSNGNLNLKRTNKNLGRLVRDLESFKFYLKKKDISFEIMYVPMIDELRNKKEYSLLPIYLKNSSIDFIDLTLEMQKRGINSNEEIQKFYYLNEGHCNGRGYDILIDFYVKTK